MKVQLGTFDVPEAGRLAIAKALGLDYAQAKREDARNFLLGELSSKMGQLIAEQASEALAGAKARVLKAQATAKRALEEYKQLNEELGTDPEPEIEDVFS